MDHDLMACMSTAKVKVAPTGATVKTISKGRYNVALVNARKALAKATPVARKVILADIRLLEECTASLAVVKKYTI
jgi:hypothetical protein